VGEENPRLNAGGDKPGSARAADLYIHTLENMLEGCQVISPDWRYLYVNQAVARQARKTKDELLGRTMMDVFPGIDDTDMFGALRRCMADRAPIQLENEFTYPDGSTGWFTLSMEPAPEGVLIVSIDITERKRAEQRIEHQLARQEALRTIDLAILGTTDLKLSLRVLLDSLTQQLGVDAAVVLLVNPSAQTLEFAAGSGFGGAVLEPAHLPISQSYPGRAALERRMVKVPDLRGRQTDVLRSPLLAAQGFVAYYGLPLVAKGQVRGVLEIFHRAPLDPDPEWLSFLEALAGQAAIAIENAHLFDGLQRSNLELTMAYDNTIEGWSRALDLRDKEGEGHTQRVTGTTLSIARAMGIGGAALTHIRRGALLHDLGTMGVPEEILRKPGPLTDSEWAVVRMHPQYAHDLLSPIAYLFPALDIPFCHHEKWDGSGYPRRLVGDQIPLAARIFAVVDVWDALRSPRPYRAAWADDQVHDYIHAQAGAHFDPRVVNVFADLVPPP
jgi:PAS domain S-box-containing protein